MQEKLREIFPQHYPKREALIPILQDVQGAFGYVPSEAMAAVARYCRMDPVEVFGVATFYAQFKFRPIGKKTVMVCQGTACHVMGGGRVLEEVRTQLGVAPGETTGDGKYTLETVACIGACALAPAMVVNKQTYGRMKAERVTEILNANRGD
ncbi:MAG: NADH-quinone oxidoreductase subunit NuoE [Syntrophobacteraceae bacterium]|nr:NADH-quinone oxidoreductase subunit NuoE [Desulfobacteraceae bacterium]